MVHLSSSFVVCSVCEAWGVVITCQHLQSVPSVAQERNSCGLTDFFAEWLDMWERSEKQEDSAPGAWASPPPCQETSSHAAFCQKNILQISTGGLLNGRLLCGFLPSFHLHSSRNSGTLQIEFGLLWFDNSIHFTRSYVRVVGRYHGGRDRHQHIRTGRDARDRQQAVVQVPLPDLRLLQPQQPRAQSQLLHLHWYGFCPRKA